MASTASSSSPQLSVKPHILQDYEKDHQKIRTATILTVVLIALAAVSAGLGLGLQISSLVIPLVIGAIGLGVLATITGIYASIISKKRIAMNRSPELRDARLLYAIKCDNVVEFNSLARAEKVPKDQQGRTPFMLVAQEGSSTKILEAIWESLETKGEEKEKCMALMLFEEDATGANAIALAAKAEKWEFLGQLQVKCLAVNPTLFTNAIDQAISYTIKEDTQTTTALKNKYVNKDYYENSCFTNAIRFATKRGDTEALRCLLTPLNSSTESSAYKLSLSAPLKPVLKNPHSSSLKTPNSERIKARVPNSRGDTLKYHFGEDLVPEGFTSKSIAIKFKQKKALDLLREFLGENKARFTGAVKALDEN